MHQEIRDLSGQEIINAKVGKHYLEHTLLTIPGASWMVDMLSMALVQVTQYKGLQ